MNNDLRSMLMGAGVALLVVGGIFGVWSMTVAPEPPSVRQAKAQEQLVRQEVQGHMREFISNWRRTLTAVDRKDPERAAAHLVVMAEIAEDLQGGRLAHKIPVEQLNALRASLDVALAAVKQDGPGARETVVALKGQCMACHATQNGPPPTLFDGQ